VNEPPRTLVVVSTFNEAASITELVSRLFEANRSGVDLLVVDDSSPDGTAARARALGGGERPIEVFVRPRKLGLASAYVDGFARALRGGYEAVVEMDADLSHDPADIVRMLEALRGADLVIGSRYVPGGRIDNWSALRRLLSRAANLYACLWMSWEVRDSTSGFRAYRCSALDPHELERIRSDGYAFQIEMTHRLLRRGARVAEVPITFTERVEGSSKLSRRIVLEALWKVPWWGISTRLEARRRRPPLVRP
jgi:dolichol-phosphate mannosyltransferase